MPSIVTPEDEGPEEEENSSNPEYEDLDLTDNADDSKIIMPEDLDPDTVLFEGGPTAGDIVEWKNLYKHVYITEISFDEYIVWRTIGRGEYKNLVKTINQMMESGSVSEVELNMYNEELICHMGILYPELTQEEFDNQLAGMPSIISQQILEQSGFRPIDTRGL